MPAITYDSFDGGLDRRLPINVQQANKLWVLRNAYTTLGKRIRKRPGLVKVAAGLSGALGLESVSGRLKVFIDRGAAFTPPVDVDVIELDKPASASASSLATVHWAEIFNGFVYVVAEYANGVKAHHYVDSTPATVTITIATPGVVSWAGHGLPNGREVVFTTTGALPTGLTAGTVYYVVSASTNTFQVSATKGGAAIDTSGTQSGVHTGTAPTWIGDANCPNSISVTKAAERIFAINGETVRYSAAGDPRDWTTSSDAGFLPVGLRQGTKEGCTAVGTFQDKLVVFFRESSQLWSVAVDPSANEFIKRIPGIGIDDAPLSVDEFALDLCFLSPYGVRSMTVAQNVDRIDDTDLGVPIDPLVVADIAVAASQPDQVQTFGVWINELGQYWVVLDAGATSKVWAYSFSRSSKIACWSEYTFQVKFTGIATLTGKVYLRTAGDLYELSATSYIDDIHLIGVEVQMAFQDAKAPGVGKQFYGMDAVFEGSPDVSFKFNPRDTSLETISQEISGDTRPGDVVPVEVVAPAIAPVFRHAKDEAFGVDAVTLYYERLGIQV